jgi:dUTP pyrophosphatase
MNINMNVDNIPVVLVKRMFEDAKLPVRSYPTDSGLDVFAYSFSRKIPGDLLFDESISLLSGDRIIVDTGLIVYVSKPGYEIQVRPRSGLALKHGITVLNSPGTIDESYRGPLKVILINHSKDPFNIKKGDKIAQLVVAPVILSDIVEVSELSESDRGAGGFGSTDLNK